MSELSNVLKDRKIRVNALSPGPIDTPIFDGLAPTKEGVDKIKESFVSTISLGLVAQYNGVEKGEDTNRLPATMREILTKSLTVRGFINYGFAAEHYAAFLREVGAGIADGRIRYREDFVDGLERAPEAFINMLEGRNFGKLIVRVGA
jgi:NADPH-dependent curcumin reductase